jgi:hypothetical protein
MVALPIRVKAVFHNGQFVPQEPCNLPEAAEVEITVRRRAIEPPAVTDPAERQRILADIVSQMAANPIPAVAPHFTRDELHERG